MTCSRVSLFDYDVGRLLQLVSRNRGIVGQKTLKGDGCLTHIAGHELPPIVVQKSCAFNSAFSANIAKLPGAA